jgi:O-antigen/teichoic acid export membrane protein
MVTSAGSQVLLGIVSFVGRTIFIAHLKTDLLGLNELFATVLYVLSLSELGIGTSITYALYAPLARNDTAQIRTYMRFFKRVYSIVGIVIILLGICFTPFIHNFVKTETPITHLELYFLLYLFGVGMTYFFSYKQILLEADQKKYIPSFIICIASIIQIIIQSVLVIVYKSYGLYILVFVFCNIAKNIVLGLITNKTYPALKNKNEIVPLTKEQYRSLKNNIKAMFLRKIGEVSIGSIDNILISSFVGLSTLGLYANYQIILEALRSALRVFYSSIAASIGNLCAVETKEKAYSAFTSLNFVNTLLFSYVSVLLVVLLQPTLTMWLGTTYLLDLSTVILIAINFYLTGTRQMVLNYHAAYGLFWADKYNPLAQAVINLSVSLLFVRKFGLDGILLGTAISSLATGIWIEPLVVYRFGFERPVRKYFFTYIKLLCVTIFIAVLTYTTTAWISFGRFGTFWAKLFFCIWLPPFCYFVVFRKNPDFKNLITLIKFNLVKNKRNSH